MVNVYRDESCNQLYLIKGGKVLVYYHESNFSTVSMHPLVRKSLTLIAKNVKSPLIDAVFYGKY